MGCRKDIRLEKTPESRAGRWQNRSQTLLVRFALWCELIRRVEIFHIRKYGGIFRRWGRTQPGDAQIEYWGRRKARREAITLVSSATAKSEEFCQWPWAAMVLVC